MGSKTQMRRGGNWGRGVCPTRGRGGGLRRLRPPEQINSKADTRKVTIQASSRYPFILKCPRKTSTSGFASVTSVLF